MVAYRRKEEGRDIREELDMGAPDWFNAHTGRDARIARAAEALVSAMDSVLGPSWRDSTLGVNQLDGDEVNAAWNELILAIEGGGMTRCD